MRPLLALVRKEFGTLFGAPTAYLALTMVALVTAVIFFERLRLSATARAGRGSQP